jgi:hypothetical protein
VYVSRDGKVTFHGRFAKFDPVGVSAGAGGAWPFTHWKCGDQTAVEASITDTAQVRGLSFNRGESRIINYAVASPKGINPETELPGQVVKDTVSIGQFGYSTWSAPELITEAGTTTGNNANDECKAFAQYYVANYAEPRNRISQLTFRSIHPDDPRAAATWDLLCGVEISDMIDVTVSLPGGGGFNAEPFFVEGIHYDVQPATPDYRNVTLTLDVSPAAYFSDGTMLGV